MHTHRSPATLALAFTFALATLTGGCSFSANYDNTRYQCAASDVCPDGHGCVRGVCLPGVDSAGPCGNMAVARQDFAAIDFADFDHSSIWDYDQDEPASVTTVDGFLVIDIPDAAEDVGGAFQVDKIFPRAASEVAIEIFERSADGVSGAYMLIEDREGDHVEFYEEDGTLYAVLHTTSVELAIRQVAFDPMAHRFWRIAEQDGEFVFSTSSDGGQWTEFARSTGQDVEGWLGAEVGLWKWGTGGGDARLVMDNLNGRVSEQDFCASASLQDDFDDGQRHPDWQLRDSGQCTVEERDGRLGFTFADSGSAECKYRSYTRFDLRASTISIEAPLADVPGLEQCLKLYFPGGQDIQFDLYQGILVGDKSLTDDSGTLFSVEFDPAAHRFWRFRGDGDTVYWEVSADGREWQVMASQQSSGWDLSQVFLELIGESDGGPIDNFGLGFDNLNITPY